MSMTIQSSVKDKILATSSETSKVENTPAEMLRDLDQQMEKRADDDATESVRDTIGFKYCLASSSGWTKSPVLWAEIGESSLTGPELVLDMTDKVVLIKEKLKAARDRQKSYADNRRKPLEFEVGDRVMLKVSPWKGVIRFGKKGKLAPSLHVPLDEIKVDKTLRFVEEPVENSDREVKRLKCSRMVVVKVYLGSKRGKVLKESSFQNIQPRRFLRSGCQSNVGCKKSCQSSEYGSDLGQVTRTRSVPLFVMHEHDRLKALMDLILEVSTRMKGGTYNYGDQHNYKGITQDKDSATSVAKSPYRLAPLEMQELSEQLRELQDKVLEVLMKEKLYAKSSVKDKILAILSETSKVANAPAEMLCDLDQQMEKRANDGCTYGLNCIGMMRTVVMDEAHASRSPVLWVEIGESSLTGLELVQETTDKVDKTLRFVEESVENSDREVKRLKCSRMVVVK
ncbi:hypothetical protein Tco_0505022, partial [Tanacetum coccineum]